jgi:ribosomal protein S18 acetylase RimI-like enzyme
MDDLEAIVAIGAAAHESTPEAHREATSRWVRQENRQYYLGWLGDQAVGMLRVGAFPPQAFVESFRVLPAYRGRGYGRQILTEVLDRLIAAEWAQIMIEVATDNAIALSLYRSCGFRAVATYMYYWLPCTKGRDEGVSAGAGSQTSS